jgi:hypothetical protein
MTRLTFFKSLTATIVLWSLGVPKLGPGAYQGRYGWHETVSDGKMDISRDEVNQAIMVCKSHDWKGYVKWTSAFGKETDSCDFMRLVAKQ